MMERTPEEQAAYEAKLELIASAKLEAPASVAPPLIAGHYRPPRRVKPTLAGRVRNLFRQYFGGCKHCHQPLRGRHYFCSQKCAAAWEDLATW